MKIKTLSYAVSAALALSTGAAHALPLSSYSSSTTQDVYISGSSAQDGSLELYIDNICKPSTLDIYHNSGSVNYRMMYCTIDTTKVSGLAKPNVLFHKSSAGGSGEGVQPVADYTQLNAMQVTSNSGTSGDNCGAGSTVTPAGGLPAYTLHSCTNTVLGLQVPDGGISDEEPAQFGATSVEQADLTIKSEDAVIFGIAVTQNVRNVLQAAEGLTVGAEDETNMPNLSRSMIGSMFAGNMYDWGQLLGNTGHPITDGTYASTSATPSDTSVYISRRVSTSGTQHGAQIYFLNQGCAPNTQIFVGGNDNGNNDLTGGGTCGTGSGASAVTGTVDSGSGTSNVKTCLNNIGAAGYWGIGILGVENVPGSSDNWRFVKINGHAPTELNVENGTYDYVMQNTVQWRSAASSHPLNLTSDVGILLQKIANENGSPTILSAVDSTVVQSWGNSGYMALPNLYTPTVPTPGIPLTAAQLLANPVTTYNKAPSGTLNNCQPPQMWTTPGSAVSPQ